MPWFSRQLVLRKKLTEVRKNGDMSVGPDGKGVVKWAQFVVFA